MFQSSTTQMTLIPNPNQTQTYCLPLVFFTLSDQNTFILTASDKLQPVAISENQQQQQQQKYQTNSANKPRPS
ncbi:hypothetical protein H5410_037842 [Solanum commersonii]|uniref:Uncharacterized protein n=1 Tax=Solanum commersonii TaxID=4109 RepID=A0A9J5Y935_SOLCO|nr:hypothetical protein H5410_037842 [Solanum commersonii]